MSISFRRILFFALVVLVLVAILAPEVQGAKSAKTHHRKHHTSKYGHGKHHNGTHSVGRGSHHRNSTHSSGHHTGHHNSTLNSTHSSNTTEDIGNIELAAQGHVSKWFSGRITWYDTHSAVDSGGFIGSCGTSIKSGYIKGYPILAMNPYQLKGSKSCGLLIDLVSPIKHNVVVTFVVADECPECPMYALDLARVEFDRIANDNTGVYHGVKWGFNGQRITL